MTHGSPVDSPVKTAAISRVIIGFCAVFLAVCGLAACSSKHSACNPNACAAGARCVQDECRAACTNANASTVCAAGQSCALWGFDDGTQGTYCVVLPGGMAQGGSAGSAGSGGASSVSTKCSANADCDPSHGAFCVGGACQLACSSHFDCQGLGECLSGHDSDGTSGHYCDLSKPQKPGQFYTSCPNGTECDSANGFLCLGAGADDLDAYCTNDCTTDESCADGFTCEPIVRAPCSDDCHLTGNPKDRSCIPSAQIGDGKPYQCGSNGVTRNVCRPRRFCNSCQTDADCLATPNQICAADQSGEKICTQLCDLKNPSCPWGNAGICGMFDASLGVATCAHKFGKCAGTGKSCEPCETSADCGAKGACTSSSFTGEHWCVDFSVACSCGSNADANGLCTGGGCPMSPSGLTMQCEDDPATTGSSTGICVGANTQSGVLASTSSPQDGCWPSL